MLVNKTILITGAAGGLGEGIARVCHREGANVVISDIRGESADHVAKSLGTRASAVRCDVRKPEDLSQLAEHAVQRFGKIDGLVNNAAQMAREMTLVDELGERHLRGRRGCRNQE